MLKIGDKAPAFIGIDQDSNEIKLSDYKGKKLVLYFYPKDSTPGCTAEACDLRDNYNGFLAKGFDIIGVSADSEKSHQNFIAKYSLPFKLISDKEKVILKAYNAWGEKKMYGKTYEGIIRKTYVISENGIIENIIEKLTQKNIAHKFYNN